MAKETTPSYAAAPRDESPPLPKDTDNKPKLFKGSSTNPFAKRTAATTGPSYAGGNSGAGVPPKSDGLFYPGGQTASSKPSEQQPATTNQFSSITSFGAKNNNNNNASVPINQRERKSSSNIEEALDYDDDDFEDESIGQSQLNPSKGGNTPINNAWGGSAKQVSDPRKQDGSSNLDDFSAGDAFEDKYDDDDFL